MLKKNGVKMNFLFVCVHNSGRSQMAEAFFNNKIGKSKHFVLESIKLMELNSVPAPITETNKIIPANPNI